MASKRIDELDARVVADADLLPVTPSGGPSGKATVAAIVAEGLSQPNSASAGAGASITLKAADGVTSGAGGSITITPGAQATTGGPGKVIIDTLTVGRGNNGVSTNTAVGASVMTKVTSGGENTAIGNLCLENLTTGGRNFAAGIYALRNVSTGSSNIGIGYIALTGITTSSFNSAVGANSLGSCTSGQYNTGLGYGSGGGITTGSYNVNLGANCGEAITTGSNNVVLGWQCARFIADGTTLAATLNNSIYIGYQARAFNNSDSNSIVIGYQAIGEGANTTVVGNSSTVQQHLYATMYIKTEGSMVFASSTPAAITASQNNYVLTGSAFQRLNCTTASDITGIAPPTSGAHVDGRMIRLVSVGTATVTLKHNSASSTAANRMYMSGAVDKALAVNAWADLVYDATDNGSGAAGWRVM